MIEAVLFGLLLLTGKWVTACLLLGVCAWDLRTYLRGEHKVRRQRVQGGRWGLQPPGSFFVCGLSSAPAVECASGGVRQRREPAVRLHRCRVCSSPCKHCLVLVPYPCPPRHAS